jgi:hypothetical protein
MRGADDDTSQLFSYLSPERRVRPGRLDVYLHRDGLQPGAPTHARGHVLMPTVALPARTRARAQSPKPRADRAGGLFFQRPAKRDRSLRDRCLDRRPRNRIVCFHRARHTAGRRPDPTRLGVGGRRGVGRLRPFRFC